MYSPNSASQWGSPTASRRALLIHGLTASSDSWQGLAQLLEAEGFFVVAPNLLGHAWRRGTDYSMSALAEDLRPYFVMDTFYDVIIGHSLGGTVTLSLLPFLPNTKETTVILLDPPLEVTEEDSQIHMQLVKDEIMNAKTPEEHMAENPTWSRRVCILRALGISMCDRTAAEGIFLHNRPMSFSGLLKNIPINVKITLLLADPKFGAVCFLEHIPQGIERLNVRVLPGIGHIIQYEHPDAIMDAIPGPLPRAKL
ncbi:Alpha/Beta hydrolase protein [Suillus clintonianus]|uniref:Alpha/Beta hydrolase protein n=1 Tax=Suillus clintonianus TaxID=1904413 RepID=UPI001B886BD6|nr:Alpha/Beta hydrolase protein [Suillus clintonianus]KAG2152884.1 Alpha/Beta hydrolase protein [Suillus clintonianus]